MAADSRIRIENVSKRFGEVEAVRNASLTVAAGEVVLIIGPSGSGKSTLLRCVNRLETATEGQIWIDNDEVTDQHGNIRLIREEVGMVFQNFNLFPHLTALENIALAPRKVKREAPEATREKARRLLARVGLADKEDVYPNQLSGGQQQRVAIARALVHDPQLVLADEPTGSLDPSTADTVLDLLLEQAAKQGGALLLVTHSEAVAARADRVLRLEQGRVRST